MSPPANPPGASNQRKRRFPYTPVACEACQRRKIKCSGAQPCERCRDSNATCSYQRTTRFRSGRHGSTGNTQGNTAAKVTASPEERDIDESNNSSAESAQNRRVISACPGASGGSGPQSFDYYVRLAESRLTKESPVQATRPPTGSRRSTLAGAHHLQQIYSLRKSKSAGKGLAVFDADVWTEILQTYDEEIGLQYPFLDTELFAERIRTAKQDVSVTSSLSPSKEVACLADPDVAEVAEPIVQDIFGPSLSRVHLGEVEDDDLSLLILTSMFLFLSDQETQAWRCIGTVMRLVQEMCSLDQDKGEMKVSDKLYWTVYTLDRRWGFGTGLPFGVSDADITRQPYALDDGSPSSAYLKQMVSYCGIASEVRRKFLSPSSPETQSSINQDSTRDYANFRLVQWQKNLPPRLRFGGVGDKLDPARERRGHFRLRLLLYLRASQMRIIILRKSVASSGLTSFESSSMQAMLDVAQDTIRVLIYLARETDIYHAQQRTFNHFLETALSSLLLVVCCNGSSSSASCLSDVVAAIELIRQLSQESKITRKLHEKLQVIQQVVDGLKTRNSSIGHPDTLTVQRVPPAEGSAMRPLRQQTPPLRQEELSSIGGPSVGPPAADAGLEIRSQSAQQWPPIAELPQDSSTGLSSAYQGFMSYDQHRHSMNMNNTLPNVFTATQDQPTLSDSSSSHVAAMPGQMPPDIYDSPVMVDSQLRDLGEILMDYEYFAF